jgi:hypothetical protein
MNGMSLDQLPGFRRRFRITPSAGWVRSEVEDDYHCMRVTVRHESAIATAIEPVMIRAPWTTCPGAVEQLQTTFKGIALSAFAVRGEKRTNCTHLHDLAVLAAAHAFDVEPLIYDILVSDPVEGQRHAELRRNAVPVMSWSVMKGQIVAPSELAGLALDNLRAWIDSLDPERQEAARLLRWGTLLAHGRTQSLEKQSDATRWPVGNCYTFQLPRMTQARRIGEIRDFSRDNAPLLASMPEGETS